jgi:hypothetical protein
MPIAVCWLSEQVEQLDTESISDHFESHHGGACETSLEIRNRAFGDRVLPGKFLDRKASRKA